MCAFRVLISLFSFQMAGWTFKDTLVAIQSPHSIPISVLLSADGVRLGDIRFAKIQTTLYMQTVAHRSPREMGGGWKL